jgi:hypothetical protein
MYRLRLTIASLLVVIAFCGVILAGLRSGTTVWMRTIYTATFVALIFATIAAKYRGAFWYGFSVAGWAYFLLAIDPWFDSSVADPSHLGNIGLLTSAVNVAVNQWLSDREPGSLDFIDAMVCRLTICHCALTIPFGLTGGLISGAMAGRRRRIPEGAQPGSASTS